MRALALLLAVIAPAASGLRDAEFAAALRGEVPTRTETFRTPRGKAAGRGVGAIVVEKSVAEVWAVLSRYEDKAEYVPRLTSVKVLEKQPDRLLVHMEVDASVTTARYTAWFKLDAAEHTIHWTLDGTARDNTLADVDGEYRLFELAPERTLVVYRTYVDTGRSVPGFIQDYMARRSIPDLLKAVKRRVESGGTWKKR